MSIKLPLERIIVIDGGKNAKPTETATSSHQPLRCLDELIAEGSTLPPFIDRPLSEGEAKTAIAFLAPSSGTTGLQKVCIILLV